MRSKALLAYFCIAALHLTFVSRAQTLLLPPADATLPHFEVATIKFSASPYIGIYTGPAGRLTAGNCSVLCFIIEAFHCQTYLVSGLPGWAKSINYDLEAVPPDDSPVRRYNPPGVNSPKLDEQRLMLQALLRDRFALRYHVATAEQPALFLEQSGKPLKLTKAKDPGVAPFMSVNVYSGGVGNGDVEGVNTTMSYTAFRLSQILNRPVLDRTGLTGGYDFHVPPPEAKDADITDATLLGISSLGLRLKAGKAPVETLVIDAVSQPTPN